MRKKSSTPQLGNNVASKLQSDHDLKALKDNSSHEEGELLSNTDKIQNNGHGGDAKLDKAATRELPYSDNSGKSRFCSWLVLIYIETLIGLTLLLVQSKFTNLLVVTLCIFYVHIEVVLLVTSFCAFSDRSVSRSPKRKLNRSRSSLSRSPKRNVRLDEQSPAHRVPEPSASNRARGISRSQSPNGEPKRVRKGRGFTDRYSFARRYRTPERSPSRPYLFGGNVNGRNRDR